MISIYFLVILSLGIIFSSVGVISAKNPVLSVCVLILVFVFASLYLIIEGANYVGLILLIIYIGAVAILFLFVLFMMDLNKLEKYLYRTRSFTQNIPLAVYIGVTFLGFFPLLLPNFAEFDIVTFLTSLATYSPSLNIISGISSIIISFTNHLTSMAKVLYTVHAILLFICGFILLQSMIGAIVTAGGKFKNSVLVEASAAIKTKKGSINTNSTRTPFIHINVRYISTSSRRMVDSVLYVGIKYFNEEGFLFEHALAEAFVAFQAKLAQELSLGKLDQDSTINCIVEVENIEGKYCVITKETFLFRWQDPSSALDFLSKINEFAVTLKTEEHYFRGYINSITIYHKETRII